jgi:hypothetical protein
VSPENRALNPKRVQYKQRLFRSPPMKVEWQLSRKSRRPPVPRPIRNHKADEIAQRFRLPVDGIGSIPPPTMQEHDWPATAHVSVVNRDGPNSSRMRRIFQFHKRHGILS